MTAVATTLSEVPAPTEPPLLVERHGAVLLLTLNRPRALNSINAAVSTALGEALDELDADPSLRVAVLTGSGRAFCAGADLKALATGEPIVSVEHPEWGLAGIVQHRVSTPVIAAVNGFALGGGTEIVLSCDLAVLDPAASLGLPEVKVGLFAAGGGVLRLQRHLPPKLAAHAALTGQPVPADECLRWGLVNTVSAPGQSVSEAMRLAEQVAANAPLGVQASKRLLRDTATLSDWESPVWEQNAREMEAVFASQDAQEGACAFAEKRAPVWSGR